VFFTCGAYVLSRLFPTLPSERREDIEACSMGSCLLYRRDGVGGAGCLISFVPRGDTLAVVSEDKVAVETPEAGLCGLPRHVVVNLSSCSLVLGGAFPSKTSSQGARR